MVAPLDCEVLLDLGVFDEVAALATGESPTPRIARVIAVAEKAAYVRFA